jgi:hypothetical protein
MATIVIHWKDKNLPPMEIKNAAYKGADSSINVVHRPYVVWSS